MPTNWSEALQVAIYTRLSNYSSLTDVANVYDEVPQDGSVFPYVTIGEAVLTENHTDSNMGMNALVTLHVWSDQLGREETKEIQALLAEALARYDLPITGYTLITCEIESENSFLDADGITRHGQSTFSIQFE